MCTASPTSTRRAIVLKGAVIFAIGAGAGLAIGMVSGLITGFSVSENLKKVSIGPFPEKGLSA
jgi:uncharacterized FAD-dependent dehydrogenase